MRFSIRALLVLSTAAFLTLSIAPRATQAQPPPVKPEIGAWGVDLTGMDTSVQAGDDFYRYVNGKWLDRTQIPPDKTDAGGMTALQDKALEEVKSILEEAAADAKAPKGSDRQKLGDWYASMMDEAKIESLGLAPIQAERDAIAAVSDHVQLARLLAANNGRLGVTPLKVGADFDRTRVNVMRVDISVGGLSIPARDVYLLPDYAPVRKLHLEHIARLFVAVGVDQPEVRAGRVQGLETKIAELMWSNAELRDPKKKNNPVTVAELARRAPGIDWASFLADAGVGRPAEVNMSTPSSITALARLIAEAPLADWKDYLDYQTLVGASPYLPRAVRDEVFAFYGKVLAGQPEPDPRWKVALLDAGGVSRPLADALSQEYVRRHVPADARPAAQAMIANLVAAFDARLGRLSWMTPETRAGARAKLAKLTIKPIYPDLWQDAKALDVVRGDALGNARRAVQFSRAVELGYLTAPPDRRIFLQPVYLVNAYANPDWNEIVFLAAIMRPPFFDPKADPAVNYGAMGAVIGHEVSHLFDDKGRLSDADGLLRDWWTEKDARQFVAAADSLARQVGSYEPLPGKHVDGRLTLGESIADLAGVVVAYDAYQRSLGGKPAPVIDGFTGDQRFFLAYGQVWRWKARDAYLDQLLKTDAHPPSNIRPSTLRNVDAWYEAFGVKPGQRMYLPPDARIRLW